MELLNLSYIYQEFPTRYLEGTVSLPASATRTKFSDFMLAMVQYGCWSTFLIREDCNL